MYNPPRGISTFIAAIFGLIIAVVAFIGLAISKGYFVDKLQKFPGNPDTYLIVLIVLGILFILFSLSSKNFLQPGGYGI
jgi:thiosulfate reductase cytochrome b subunit